VEQGDRQDAPRPARRGVRLLAALLLAGVAVLAAAWWLRDAREGYLALVAAATALGAALAVSARGRWHPGMAALFALAAIVFLAPAWAAQRSVHALDADGDAMLHRVRTSALTALDDSVAKLAAEADTLARAALARTATLPEVPAPGELLDARTAAFQRLQPLVRGAPERAVAVLRRGVPVAWAGLSRLRPDSLPQGSGIVVTPLWTVLHASASAGRDRAVATVLLHAAKPADTLSVSLDRAIARAVGARAFEFAARRDVDAADAGRRASGAPALAADSVWRPIGGAGSGVVARALLPSVPEARQRAIDEGRRRGAPAVLAMALLLVVAAWRRPASLQRRVLVLLVPLGAIAAAPLNTLSNASALFDPALFFAAVGGPFTASIGALALSAALVLVGLFAVLRAGRPFAARPVAVLAVLAIAGVAPFVLRALSRGITPPALGVTVWLWIAWELALFLAGAVILVAGSAAGRAAVRGGRGLHPLAAPVLAGMAAIAGPLFWEAPAGWPGWYPLFWVAAVAALALTRRTRAVLVGAAAVAGLGASTLVWSATARKRVELAVRDVQGLATPDPDALLLLDRFGRTLADRAVEERGPVGAGELLRRFAESPLASAGFPVSLASWGPPDSAVAARAGVERTLGAVLDADTALARVATAVWPVDTLLLRAAVRAARDEGAPVLRVIAADPGVAPVLAVPQPDGSVTTVIVFPRTRLSPESPVATLLGLPRPLAGDPPYTLSLLGRVARPDASPARAAEAAGVTSVQPRWTREGSDVHGDWLVPLPDGWTRVHAEVELRPFGVLVQRGALLVMLDLLVIGVLWALPALADGAAPRWWRWWRGAWRRSYRARLTVALFAFFAVPTSAFAVWSYRQLQAGDRQSRELLVRETLRATVTADTSADVGELRALADRAGTPLLVYEHGVLARASDPAVVDVAPFGRLLPPALMLAVVVGDEITASDQMRVGPAETLVGFRAALVSPDERLVIAAPARNDDVAVERRRRDLGFLVALAAMGGALAALWLSGLAARELSRPVGALRAAALAIAGEERGRGPTGLGSGANDALQAALATRPPAEFRPVFGAFRRMAADLAASRAALDAARRRTAAVLRDVASGVVAVDAKGCVTLANPSAEALLDRALPPGDALDALAPPTLAARVHAFLATESAEEAFDLELHGRQLRARLTRLGGAERRDATGAVLTLDDLTELTRAQRVLAWGEMARQVAHEIKNPLTPIRLGVQHLRRAFRDGRPDFDAILERNVDRVLGEIDRLDEIARTFSRYGMAPEHRAPAEATDVAAVARDVVALERMGQGALTWELSGADAPALALARDGELREVLLNLLENARLAHARRVRVTLAAADGEVALHVEDDGHGIPGDVVARIFEPHFSTRTSGSGLGLAISRRLVDSWGGSITVDSAPGVGTTMTVTLRAA
jgi:signal transduction histidine kinase